MLLRANLDNLAYVMKRQKTMRKMQKEFEEDLEAKFEAAVAELKLQKDAVSKAHYITLREGYGNLEQEISELERWRDAKEEQNAELHQLGKLFVDPNRSFDLIKTSTKVGSLFHRFTSLKMESQQSEQIKTSLRDQENVKE